MRRSAAAVVVLTLLLAPLFYLALTSGKDSWTSVAVLEVGTTTVAESVLEQARGYEQPQQRLATELEVLQSDAVSERALDLLSDVGLVVGEAELRERVTSSARGVSTLIEVRGEGEDARSARDLTSAVVTAYIEYRRDDQRNALQRLAGDLRDRLVAAEDELETLDAATADPRVLRQRASAQDRLAEIQSLLDRVRIRLSLDSSGVNVLSPPQVPQEPEASLSSSTALVASALAALLLSTGLVLFLDLLRNPVRSRAEAEEVALVPILAELPVGGGRGRSDLAALARAASSPTGLAARSLRLRLEASGRGTFPALVTVVATEADAREAATVGALLASACGRARQRTLLVLDLDSLDTLVDEPEGGPRTLEGGLSVWDSVLADVDLAATVADSEAELGLLDVRSPAEALRAAQEAYDVVVVVEPPVAGSSAVAPMAQAVLLVCALGRTRAPRLVHLLSDLEYDGTPVSGLVLLGGSARRRPHRTRRATQAPEPALDPLLQPVPPEVAPPVAAPRP